MSFLRKVFSLIADMFKANDSVQGSPVFPKIDPDKIKKQLQIAENAKRHGEKGLPLESATQLTDVEHSILGHLGSHRESLVKWATAALKQNQDRLDSIDITSEINRTIKLGEEYERDADKLISKQDSEIKELRDIAQAKTKELEEFRHVNNLTKLAKIRTGSITFFHGTLILLCVAIEGAMNSIFFAEGLSSGLIGGFVFSITLSAVNVILCFSMGRLIPYKNHAKNSNRINGYMAGLLAIFFTVYIGLITAHIRDSLPQITDDSQSPWVVAKDSLIASPFVLNDIISYILWSVTIFFGLIAIFEGYFWNDTYPGYTKIYITYENAQRNYVDALEKLRSNIDTYKTEALTQLDSSVEKSKNNIKYFKQNMKTKQITKKRLDEGMVLADETLKGLIRMYRIENQLARPLGNKSPDYFDDPIDFTDIPVPKFGLEDDELKLIEQELKMAKMVSMIEVIRAKVQSSLNNKYDQLQPLQQVF